MEKEKLTEIISLLKSIKAEQKEIMSFKEAWKYLDISESALYKMTSNNKIKFSKPSGKIYFRKTDLDEWMLQNTNTTVSEIEGQVNKYLKGGSYGE